MNPTILTLSGTFTAVEDIAYSLPNREFWVTNGVTINEVRTQTNVGLVPHISGNTLRGALRTTATSLITENLPQKTLSIIDMFVMGQGGLPAKKGSIVNIARTENPVVNLFGAITSGPVPLASKSEVASVFFGSPVSTEDLRKAYYNPSDKITNVKFIGGVRFPLERRTHTTNSTYRMIVTENEREEYDRMNEVGAKSLMEKEVAQDESLDAKEKRKKIKESKDDMEHNQVLFNMMAIPAGNSASHLIRVVNPTDEEVGLLIRTLERFSMNPVIGARRAQAMGTVSMNYNATLVVGGIRTGEHETITVGRNPETSESTFTFTKGGYLSRCYDAFEGYLDRVRGGDLDIVKVHV